MKKRVILRTTEMIKLIEQYAGQALAERVDGEPVLHEVTIRPHKSKRSLEQNAYYWKLITDICMHLCGDKSKTATEKQSMDMKVEFLEPLTKTPLPDGRFYVTYKSTADMTIKELAEFCECVERWAIVELGFERHG